MYGKFIIILIVSILVAGGIFAVAATGLWQVPILSDLLRTDKPIDLGIASAPVYFNSWRQKYDIALLGDLAACNDSCQITYQDVKKQWLFMSSEELSSYLNTFYAGGLPISDIQVKLDDGNFAEVSAWLDLSDFGYQVSVPIYLRGSVELVDGQTIALDITNAKLGLLPLPNKYYAQAKTELERIFNKAAASISGYNLDSIDITDGQLNISGQLPQTITVK